MNPFSSAPRPRVPDRRAQPASSADKPSCRHEEPQCVKQQPSTTPQSPSTRPREQLPPAFHPRVPANGCRRLNGSRRIAKQPASAVSLRPSSVPSPASHGERPPKSRVLAGGSPTRRALAARPSASGHESPARIPTLVTGTTSCRSTRLPAAAWAVDDRGCSARVVARDSVPRESGQHGAARLRAGGQPAQQRTQT